MEEDTIQTETYYEDYEQPSQESIHGWLAFFLVVVGIGGTITMISDFIGIDWGVSLAEHIMALGDPVMGVLFFALAVYTIYAFLKRQPNAVFLGKSYVVVVFLSNLLLLLNGEFTSSGIGSVTQIVRSLVWAVIWYLFLSQSAQVERIFPYSYRRVTAFDWTMVVGVLAIPLALIGIGLGILFSQNLKDNAAAAVSKELTVDDLRRGEQTDGRIIYRLPDMQWNEDSTYIVDSQTTLRSLSADEGDLNICSGFDSNNTQENFDDYCLNWEDTNLGVYPKETIDDSQLRFHNCNGYYRVTRYTVNTTNIYWEMALLFNQPTSKVAVVSYITTGDPSQFKVKEVARSLRFE